MNLTINGEQYSFETPITVKQLVDKLELDIEKIAIECNLEVVPFAEFEQTILSDGDKLEIIHFIGGG